MIRVHLPVPGPAARGQALKVITHPGSRPPRLTPQTSKDSMFLLHGAAFLPSYSPSFYFNSVGGKQRIQFTDARLKPRRGSSGPCVPTAADGSHGASQKGRACHQGGEASPKGSEPSAKRQKHWARMKKKGNVLFLRKLFQCKKKYIFFSPNCRRKHNFRLRGLHTKISLPVA